MKVTVLLLSVLQVAGCYQSHAAARGGDREPGEPELTNQRILFLQGETPIGEFARPRELHSVWTDGSEPQQLLALDETTIRGQILGVEGNRVITFADLNGIPVALHFTRLDGSGTDTIDNFAYGPTWTDGTGIGVWVGGASAVRHHLADGSSELTALGGAPFFMSRSRRYVAVRTREGSELIDRIPNRSGVFAPTVALDDPDSLCRSQAAPAYWLNADEDYAFVFPLPGEQLGLASLDDDSGIEAIEVTPGFRPIGFDRCRNRLLAYDDAGDVYSVDLSGSMQRVGSAAPLSSPQFRFSPNGRFVVAASDRGPDHAINVFDLETGGVGQTALPTQRPLLMGNSTDEFFVVGTGLGLSTSTFSDTPSAHRIDLGTLEMTSAPFCAQLPPQLTEDHRLLICRDEPGRQILGIQESLGSFQVVGDNPTQVLLLPSDAASEPCIDADSEFVVLRTCV